MTKEELKQEAEEKTFSYVQLIPCASYMEKRHREIDYREGYIEGAEPREKRIAELEAQIEKMKSDVRANIKWADKNCDNMWQKLVKMWNEWENKYGK